MGIRILLVDDEPMMASTLVRALHPYDIAVDGVVDTDQFLRVAADGNHDALVIDWNLRTCEGTHLCAQMRESGERRPIAIFSGKLDAAYGRRIAEDAGADVYIEKPTDVRSLVTELRSLTSDRRPPTRRSVVEVSSKFRCLAPDGFTIKLELHSSRVTVTDLVVQLRPKEIQLLSVLLNTQVGCYRRRTLRGSHGAHVLSR